MINNEKGSSWLIIVSEALGTITDHLYIANGLIQ